MIRQCVPEAGIHFPAKGRPFGIALRSIAGRSGLRRWFRKGLPDKPANNRTLALYGGYGYHAVEWG
ncbi:MAG: hypothetical protein P1P82_05530 [Bacteroidales bacterium]|nr:hypothetical protein [Bacteroidales bacterium]